MKWLEKMKEYVYKFCELMEMVLAFFIIVGLILTFIKSFADPQIYVGIYSGEVPFTSFLDKMFDVIIGVELLQILCRPKSDSILEMLIFLVTRHLVVHYSNSLMDILSILIICLLFIIRFFIRTKEKETE